MFQPSVLSLLIHAHVLCSLFNDITEDEVKPKLTAAGVEIYTVKSDTYGDEEQPHGLRVNCNGVDCIFEFRMFQYKGDCFAPTDQVRRRCESAFSIPASLANQCTPCPQCSYRN